MEPNSDKKEITSENQNDKNRKNDSENNKEDILGDNQNAINGKMESENDKNEIIRRWNELLSNQPKALIHSTRSPTPLSPFIWFCLSKQQSIREELCRENPDITVSIFTHPLRYVCVVLQKMWYYIIRCIFLFS
jgi:hypothetical protein